jgi:hypothetical protein
MTFVRIGRVSKVADWWRWFSGAVLKSSSGEDLGSFDLCSRFSVEFLMPFTGGSHTDGIRSKTCGQTNGQYSLHLGGLSLPTTLHPLWLARTFLLLSGHSVHPRSFFAKPQLNDKAGHIALGQEKGKLEILRATVEGAGYR